MMGSETFIFPFGMMAVGGLIYLVGIVLWIWAIVETIKSGETDGAKIAWILILIFIPVLGFLIWLFAGPRKRIEPS